VDEDGFEADESRFRRARNGDSLLTPFQCDVCHFRNIKHCDPRIGDKKDVRLLKDIRVANLNDFWVREPSTVVANLKDVRTMEKIGEEIYGFDSVGPPMGPFPLEDNFGMKVGCVLLARSLDPGKNERYIQFSTARKIRSAYSNMYHASSKIDGGDGNGLRDFQDLRDPVSDLWILV
jgi:hypothetical protein